MTTLDRPLPAPPVNRNTVVAASVILFHVAALWALQTGLAASRGRSDRAGRNHCRIHRAAPPKVEPPPVPQAARASQAAHHEKGRAPLPPPPMPVAIADPTPAPNAPTGVTAPQPPAPPIAAPVAAAPAPVAPPPPPKVELPSSDADYLQNPKPAYPPSANDWASRARSSFACSSAWTARRSDRDPPVQRL
jgi:protein TonB